MTLTKKLTTLSLSAVLLVACGINKDNSKKESKKSSDKTEQVSSNKKETIEFQYKVDPNTWQIVPIEGTGVSEKVALLTYDDAPDQYALEIAQKLVRLNAPAIFFVNGMFLDNPEGEKMLKEIHDLGFEIGNHTYTHPDLTSLTYEEQLKEIKEVNDRVEEIVGERPRFIRPPFGLFDENTEKIISNEQMTLMNWTYGYDWEEQYQTGPALADIMVNTEFLSPGANLLMHDRSWTLDAQEAIISGLREKGYELVDPDRLISQREMKQ